MKVQIPPLDVLGRFACQVDGIFEQVKTLRRQVHNLRQTRDLLLPRLLSGQIDLDTV
jgi:type I restriction enzyme S subunit